MRVCHWPTIIHFFKEKLYVRIDDLGSGWFFQSDLCCLSTCNLRLYMSYSTQSPRMVVLVPNRIAQPGTCWAHTSKCFLFHGYYNGFQTQSQYLNSNCLFSLRLHSLGKESAPEWLFWFQTEEHSAVCGGHIQTSVLSLHGHHNAFQAQSQYFGKRKLISPSKTKGESKNCILLKVTF